MSKLVGCILPHRIHTVKLSTSMEMPTVKVGGRVCHFDFLAYSHSCIEEELGLKLHL